MKVRPLRDKVLIKRIDSPETTKGGIIIPETAAEAPQEGEVVAVGTGYIHDNGQIIPLEVAKGDRVLFAKFGGTEITLDGDDYTILHEGEVLAVIE